MNEFPFSSYLLAAAFTVAVATTVGGALIAALSRRIIRGVAGLMVCCLGLAGLFYFLNSPFLALMEILIYVGAVCVTIVFGVMLSEPEEPRTRETPGRLLGWGGLGIVACGAIFIALARLGLTGPWPEPPARPGDGSVHAIGVSLLTHYSMAFELISLVLLVAIMGALVVARPGRTRK